VRSDTKSLLNIFGWTFILVLAVTLIAIVAVLYEFSPAKIAYLMLGCLVVGAVIIGAKFGPELMRRGAHRDSEQDDRSNELPPSDR
jgi:uncharacterized membrane protein